MQWMKAVVLFLRCSRDTTTKNFHYFQFTISRTEDRYTELPHLMHTPDSLGFDVTLDKVDPSSSSTRYAIELAFVTSLSAENKTMTLNVTKSVDDEHTPGIFKVKIGFEIINKYPPL